MSKRKYPTQEYLRQCFRYENGRLFWLERPVSHFTNESKWKRWKTMYEGKEAGSITIRDGGDRCYVGIGRINFRRHRVVWLLHNAVMPKLIDHKNRNTLDDRIENLRPANRSQNQGNKGKPVNNTSGIKGVRWDKEKNKWRAGIGIYGKLTHLGYYDDPLQAQEAYLAAAERHFGQFVCSG